jgi:uncharacterized damage-inducible protein DinB
MDKVTQTERIADLYRAATLQDAWYGPSLGVLLRDIPPEVATTAPVPGAHTIGELLQHLLLWNERVRNTLAGSPMPKWEPEREWAEPPIPWKELTVRWEQSRDALEQSIRKFPSEDAPRTVPGRNYSHEVLLEGIVQHVIYHSGQIAMIASMLRSRTRRQSTSGFGGTD